ncbi:hypothetical protein BHE74_00040923 [Ensete ventricosum]|nr:hypothetical protein BHE74_00040923 [Ensete ventricosum]
MCSSFHYQGRCPQVPPPPIDALKSYPSRLRDPEPTLALLLPLPPTLSTAYNLGMLVQTVRIEAIENFIGCDGSLYADIDCAVVRYVIKNANRGLGLQIAPAARHSMLNRLNAKQFLRHFLMRKRSI